MIRFIWRITGAFRGITRTIFRTEESFICLGQQFLPKQNVRLGIKFNWKGNKNHKFRNVESPLQRLGLVVYFVRVATRSLHKTECFTWAGLKFMSSTLEMSSYLWYWLNYKLVSVTLYPVVVISDIVTTVTLQRFSW